MVVPSPTIILPRHTLTTWPPLKRVSLPDSPFSPATPRPPYCTSCTGRTALRCDASLQSYARFPTQPSTTPHHTRTSSLTPHSLFFIRGAYIHRGDTQRYFVLEQRELKYYREEIRHSDHGNRGGYHAEPRGAIHLGGGGVRVVTSENTVRTQDHHVSVGRMVACRYCAGRSVIHVHMRSRAHTHTHTHCGGRQLSASLVRLRLGPLLARRARHASRAVATLAPHRVAELLEGADLEHGRRLDLGDDQLGDPVAGLDSELLL